MIAAVLEDKLPVILASPTGSADIGRKDDVTVTDEKLNKRIPRFGVLAIHRVAE